MDVCGSACLRVHACAYAVLCVRAQVCAWFVYAVVFVRGACVRACLSALLCRRACLRTHARTCAFPDRGAFSPWCAFAHARMRARVCMHAVRSPCPGKGRAGRRLQAGQTQSRRCIARLQRCKNRTPPDRWDSATQATGRSSRRRRRRRRQGGGLTLRAKFVVPCPCQGDGLRTADSDRPAPTAGLICPTRRRTWIMDYGTCTSPR